LAFLFHFRNKIERWQTNREVVNNQQVSKSNDYSTKLKRPFRDSEYLSSIEELKGATASSAQPASLTLADGEALVMADLVEEVSAEVCRAFVFASRRS
jgi:hypothetical protein